MRTNWTICGNLMFPRKCDKLTTEIHFEPTFSKNLSPTIALVNIFFKNRLFVFKFQEKKASMCL